MGHHLAKITPTRLAAWDAARAVAETRDCAKCGREFAVKFGPSQINCSAECSAEWRKERDRRRLLVKEAIKRFAARQARRCEQCGGPIGGRANKYCRECVVLVRRIKQKSPPKPRLCSDCGRAIEIPEVRCSECKLIRKNQRKAAYSNKLWTRYQADPEFRGYLKYYRDDRRNKMNAAWLVAREMRLVQKQHRYSRCRWLREWRQNEEAGLRYVSARWQEGASQVSSGCWCLRDQALDFPITARVEWAPTRRRQLDHQKLAVLVAFEQLGLTAEEQNNGTDEYRNDRSQAPILERN